MSAQTIVRMEESALKILLPAQAAPVPVILLVISANLGNVHFLFRLSYLSQSDC